MECVSLRKKPTAMPRPPSSHPHQPRQTDGRLSRAHPRSHALSHTFPPSGATEHVQARQHPRVLRRGRCPPETDMHTQPLKQDPTQRPPTHRTHTHRPPASPNHPDSQPSATHPEMGDTFKAIQPIALMGKLRPREGKGIALDSPLMTETEHPPPESCGCILPPA